MEWQSYSLSLSRRTRLSIAVLTLLAHLVTLLVLFKYTEYNPLEPLLFSTPDNKQKSPQDQDLAKHLEYDSVILSQSPHDQGAHVIFADEPEPVPTAPAPMLPTPQADDEQTAQAIPAEEILKTTEEEPAPLLPEPVAPEVTTDDRQEPLNATLMQTSPHDYQEMLPSPPQEKPKRRRRRKKRLAETPPITMAQLAKGFLKSMEQERGAATYHEQDMHKLAQQIYATKVWSHFKTVINAGHIKPHTTTFINIYSIITVTIAKNGQLLDFRFQHDQHDGEIIQNNLQELQELFARVLQHSGLFPPIPKQFEVDTVTLHASISMQLPPGQTIILTINNRY